MRNESGITVFEIVHNCVVAEIRHSGDPPELFESPWIPVVLEGKWSEGTVQTLAGSDSHYFFSDRMLVKHTNEYASANEERISEAPPDGFLEECAFDDLASQS